MWKENDGYTLKRKDRSDTTKKDIIKSITGMMIMTTVAGVVMVMIVVAGMVIAIRIRPYGLGESFNPKMVRFQEPA